MVKPTIAPFQIFRDVVKKSISPTLGDIPTFREGSVFLINISVRQSE